MALADGLDQLRLRGEECVGVRSSGFGQLVAIQGIQKNALEAGIEHRLNQFIQYEPAYVLTSQVQYAAAPGRVFRHQASRRRLLKAAVTAGNFTDTDVG